MGQPSLNVRMAMNWKLPSEMLQDDVFVLDMQMPVNGGIGGHFHAQGQLFALERGLTIVETAAGSWMLPPRRCGWIPPGHPHEMRSCGQARGWSLFLESSLCSHLPKDPLVLSLSPLLDNVVMRIATWRTDAPSEEVKNNLIRVLLDEIQLAQRQPLHLPMPVDSRLKQLVKEIAEQPESDHPLDYWARRVGMSERSLIRTFPQEVGMTIGQWRQQLRIMLALERLSEGLSVTATCFAVGYGNVSAFIKAFKRLLGVTPLEYLKNQKKMPSDL